MNTFQNSLSTNSIIQYIKKLALFKIPGALMPYPVIKSSNYFTYKFRLYSIIYDLLRISLYYQALGTTNRNIDTRCTKTQHNGNNNQTQGVFRCFKKDVLVSLKRKREELNGPGATCSSVSYAFLSNVRVKKRPLVRQVDVFSCLPI